MYSISGFFVAQAVSGNLSEVLFFVGIFVGISMYQQTKVTIMALTELEVKKAKVTDKPQKLADGGVLFLLVHPNGGKYWRNAYRFAGKQKTLAVGIYQDVALADARGRCKQARKLLANDTDPGAVKQAQKAAKVEAVDNSFAALAAELHKIKSPMWTPVHAKQWMGNLEKYALAVIGKPDC